MDPSSSSALSCNLKQGIPCSAYRLGFGDRPDFEPNPPQDLKATTTLATPAVVGGARPGG